MSTGTLSCGSGFCSPIISAESKLETLDSSAAVKNLLDSTNVRKMMELEGIQALTLTSSKTASAGATEELKGCGSGFCSPIF